MAEAGSGVEVQRVLGRDDPGAVDLEARQRLGVGAGGQDDVGALVPVAVDLDRVRRDQPALALDVSDLVRLHQALQALVEAADDPVLVRVDGLEVDAVERGLHTEDLGLTGVVGHLAGVQQGLGGDAPTVQAGAADLVLLDEDHGLAELGGPERRGVAAAAASQDDDIVTGGLAHVLLQRSRCARTRGSRFMPGTLHRQGQGARQG
jgi:hypothetical protein